jgi:fatty acid-binding protein DegV
VRMFGALETIEYLARGGRVPHVASWGVSVLNVRPVVKFEQGGARLVQLAHGQVGARRALLRQTLRAVGREEAGSGGANVHCVVFHGDAAAEATRIEAELRVALPDADVEISEFTPAMGVHTGPGVTGTALYVKAA